MTRIIEFVIGGLFIFSAVTKLIDFQNTVNFIMAFSGLGFNLAKNGLAFLSTAEIIMGINFFTKRWKVSRIYTAAIIFMAFFFIIINITMLIGGYSNCGCFGTQIESDPIFSLIKNLLILAFMLYEKLKQKTIQTV